MVPKHPGSLAMKRDFAPVIMTAITESQIPTERAMDGKMKMVMCG